MCQVAGGCDMCQVAGPNVDSCTVLSQLDPKLCCGLPSGLRDQGLGLKGVGLSGYGFKGSGVQGFRAQGFRAAGIEGLDFRVLC